jgi:hypothetical protein
MRRKSRHHDRILALWLTALVLIIAASPTPAGFVCRMTVSVPLAWAHIISGDSAKHFALRE